MRESMSLTDSFPSITALSSLLATVQTLSQPAGQFQTCAYRASASRGARLGAGKLTLTSERAGSARPLLVQSLIPVLPVRYVIRTQAACLFLEAGLVEYETVNASVAFVFPLGSGKNFQRTLGNVSGRYGNAQLPSNAIAAFSLPSASPHQPAPSLAGEGRDRVRGQLGVPVPAR